MASERDVKLASMSYAGRESRAVSSLPARELWVLALLAYYPLLELPAARAQVSPRETITVTSPGTMFWQRYGNSNRIGAAIDVYVHNNRSTYDPNDRYRLDETVHSEVTRSEIRPLYTDSTPGKLQGLTDPPTPPSAPALGSFSYEPASVSGCWKLGSDPGSGTPFTIERHSTVVLSFKPANSDTWTKVDAVDLKVSLAVFAVQGAPGRSTTYTAPVEMHLYLAGGSDEDSNCPSCDQCSTAKPEPRVEDGQAAVSLDMGTDSLGRSGSVDVSILTPDSNLFLSASSISGAGRGLEYVKDGNGRLSRVIGGQAVAQIMDPEPSFPGFEMRLYHSEAEADAATGEFASLQLSYANSVVNVVENYLGTTRSYSFTYDPATRLWSLQHEDDDRVFAGNSSGNSGTATSFDVTVTESTASGEVISKERHTYSRVGGVNRLVRVVRDPDGRALTTDYEYNADGQVTAEEPDIGPWQEFTYDTSNRLRTKKRIQFGEAARTAADGEVQVVTTDHKPAGSPTKLTVETLLGQEVRRIYRVDVAGGYDRFVATVPGAAWNAASNLKTSYRFCTEGEFLGKPLSVTRPDGSRTLYSYSRDSGTGTITVVKDAGAPQAGNPNVIADGLRTIRIMGEKGRLLARTVTDIATGLTVAEELTLAQDAFGRPTRTRTLGGTETRSYGCCGLESLTKATGLTTTYTKTARVRTETRQGIKTTQRETGRTTKISRRGTDGSSVDVVEMERDLVGDIVRWEDALGRATLRSEQVDAQSRYRTVTLTYPDGGTRVEVYFPDGRLQSIGGTAARPQRFEYGVSNNLRTTKVIAVGDQGETAGWHLSYVDMAGRLVREEESHERGTPAVTQYFYNAKAQLEKLIDPDGVTGLFAYNEKGELVTEAIDANGNGLIDLSGSDRVIQWERVYAQRDGQTVLRVTRKELRTNGSNEATSVEVAEEAVSGLESWTTVAGGLTTHLVTTLLGDGNSTVTEVFPDGSRRVRQVVNGFLSSVSLQDGSGATLMQSGYGYDPHGRLGSETDSRKGASQFTYYDDDRMKSVTGPVPGDGGAAPVIQYSYDARGRPDLVSLPGNGTMDYDYFPSGDLQRRSGAKAYAVEYTYDRQGRMKTMSTAGGLTEWSYFPESGRVQRKLHGDGQGSAFSYTAAGRPATRVNGRGISIQAVYNGLGDLVRIDPADASPDVDYAYTREGRVAAVTQGGSVHGFAYTPLGQVESETVTGGLLHGLVLDPAYDLLERRTGWRAVASGWEHSTGYAYDAVSRLRSVTVRNREVRYGYVPGCSLVESTTFLTGGKQVLQSSRVWDHLDRLQALNHQGSGSGIHQSFAYVYNAADQRTRITREDGGTWEFGYDSLGQLSSGKERLPDGTLRAGRQFEYDFDGIGNRSAVRFGGDAAGSGLRQRGYTSKEGDGTQIGEVNDPGRALITGWANSAALVSIDGVPVQTRQGDWFQHELSLGNAAGAVEARVRVDAVLDGVTESEFRTAFVPPAQSQFAYDVDGNMTSDGFLEYTWDANNRLRQVRTRTGAAPTGTKTRDFRQEMDYDYAGRRVRRTLYVRIDGQEHLASDVAYVYDGWRVAAEVDARNGALLRNYVWGLDLSGSLGGAGGAGGLLSVADARLGQVHHAVADGSGNVTGMANALTGAQSAAYQYDPFGNSLGVEGEFAARNPFRFSTQYLDESPDLYDYGFRYYDPRHGRWLSRDPLGEPGGVNLYGFVGNDPVGAVDSLGLDVYAIDGTWANVEGENPKWSETNVSDFVERVRKADIEDAHYFGGPGVRTHAPSTKGKLFHGITGAETYLIAKDAKDQICGDYWQAKRDGREFKVNLVGWSRGAVAAIWAAKLLNDQGCSCEDITDYPQVNFLGLYDAVQMITPLMPGRLPWDDGPPESVPPNVKTFFHAIKTGPSATILDPMPLPSKRYGHPGEYEYGNRFFPEDPSTHGDIGVDPAITDAYFHSLAFAFAAGVHVDMTYPYTHLPRK